MAQVTELVTRFGFNGSASPLREYNNQLGSAIGGLAKMSTAVLAAGAAVAAFGNSALRSLNPLVQLSKNSEVAVSEIQSLGFAAQATGSTVQAVETTLSSLAQTIGDANISGLSDDFLRLGVGSVRNANGELKTSQELFFEIAGQLRQLDRIEQFSMAQRLGIDESLLDLINLSSSELSALRREAELYGKITEEQSEGISRYNNAIGRIEGSFTILKNTLALSLAPALEYFANTIGSFIRDNGKRFSEMLGGLNIDTGQLSRVMKILGGVVAAVAGSKVLGALLKVITPIRLAIVGLFIAAEDLFVGMEGGKSVIRDFFKSFFGYDIAGLKDDVIGLASSVSDTLAPAFEFVGELVSQIWDAIKSAVEGAKILINAFGDGELPSVNVNTNQQYLTDDALIRIQQRSLENISGVPATINYNVDVKQDISTSNPERAGQVSADRVSETLDKTTRQQRRAVEGG